MERTELIFRLVDDEGKSFWADGVPLSELDLDTSGTEPTGELWASSRGAHGSRVVCDLDDDDRTAAIEQMTTLEDWPLRRVVLDV